MKGFWFYAMIAIMCIAGVIGCYGFVKFALYGSDDFRYGFFCAMCFCLSIGYLAERLYLAEMKERWIAEVGKHLSQQHWQERSRYAPPRQSGEPS